jgi:hypothetical protein
MKTGARKNMDAHSQFARGDPWFFGHALLFMEYRPFWAMCAKIKIK